MTVTVHSANVIRGGVVLSSLAFAILSSYGMQFGSLPRASFQPSSLAFGIWGPIFLLIAVAGVASIVQSPSSSPEYAASSYLLAASLVACGVWSLLVSKHAAASSVFICAAALLSVVSISL